MKYFIIILFVLILLYLLMTYIMFVFICKRFKRKTFPIIDKSIDDMLVPYKDIIDEGNTWMDQKSSEIKDVYIKSNDNLRLHGILLKNKKNKGVIIEAHGYRSTAKRDLYPSCRNYYDLGYSLLIIDHRATSLSEGKYITFGIHESEDIICWCKYVNEHFKNIPIILAGISMGATSVMMAIKDITEDMNVKCVLTDSGYVNAYDEVVYCINHYFHLNGSLFIKMINNWCKLIGKFDLNSKNVIECIEGKTIPLLLAHGESDDFVPPINSRLIYNAYQGRKEIMMIPNAQHGIGYLVNKKKYLFVLNDFINRVFNTKYLNLYDKNGKLVKQRGVRGESSEYLKGISMIFIENSKGEFLIQKTSFVKGSEFATTGGHVTYGSDFKKTIITEVKEEMGLDISHDNIKKVYSFAERHYYITVFYLKKDIDIKDVVVEPSEVEYAVYLSKDKINELIKNNEFRKSNIEPYKYITK